MSFPLSTFESLTVSYVIKGKVVNWTPLRVGAGHSEALTSVDNPVLTIRMGDRQVPVIPGSTWKGLLRSEAERFVRSTEGLKGRYGEVWRSCDILAVTNDDKLRKEEEENPCAVCRVFGNTGIASHVRLFDSYPISSYTLQTITRVSINRVTGAQNPGRLFNVQLVSPMTEWSFEMHVINVDLEVDSPESEIISYLMKRLLSGVQVGGGKSVGYGLVELRREGLRVREYRVGEEGLISKEYSGDEAAMILGVMP